VAGFRISLAVAFLSSWQTATAATLHVALGGTGDGTASAPYGRIQDAIGVAHAGDVVLVEPGTYAESLRTIRPGSDGAPITVKAAGARGSVIVRASGRVLTVGHPYFTVDALVLDGNYGQDDIVRVATAGDHFVLRHSEVLRSSKDGIDMGAPSDVLIEDSLIHHTLNAAGGRTDAHGVVAGAVHRLTIRRTEIHTFSGDAVQLDPRRAAPGWNDVLVETCKLWLAPLQTAENGFAAGTVPGENAIDTKSNGATPRARIVIRDTDAWGFRNGLITNMAAFNFKENIDAVVDGVTVWDSEIAFRVRGPSERRGPGAWARLQNAVIYDTTTAFRYEDDVQNLKIWNVTIGGGVARAMQAANAHRASLDIRNLLVLGSTLPHEAVRRSNLAVDASSFVNAAKQDYALAAGSPAIDAGETIADVDHDRTGAIRPRGRRYDVGAFER
jgi:hypothetical protein